MKRFLVFLIFSLCLFLSSCSKGSKIEHSYTRAHKFNYSGHSYIEFQDDFRHGFIVIHDPDCSCFTISK